MRKSKKSKKGLGIVLSSILIVAALGYIAYYKGWINFDKETKPISDSKPNQEKPKLKILDLNSNTRPFAVMIDNVSGARPQSGLQSAYIVYEITVEGGLTRLMALFKDVDLKAIGPVRSSRDYYLDYVMENDAIYIHHGWSPQAQSDISSLKINNLNGLANPSNMFYRVSAKASPHNSYTSSAKALKAATNKKYRLTSDNYQLLEYSIDSLDLSTTNFASSVDAKTVEIPYTSITAKYVYDETTKNYLRYANSKKHIEELTNEQLQVKNIIVVQDVTVTAVSGDAKKRIKLGNIGSGKGYYISEGKAIKITWQKKSRKDKTIYKDENGQILKVNDGNTFIQIQPAGKTIDIK